MTARLSGLVTGSNSGISVRSHQCKCTPFCIFYGGEPSHLFTQLGCNTLSNVPLMYVNGVNKILKPPFNIMHSSTTPSTKLIINNKNKVELLPFRQSTKTEK